MVRIPWPDRFCSMWVLCINQSSCQSSSLSAQDLFIVVLYPVLLSSSSPLNDGGQTFIPVWRLSLFTSLYPIYLSQALSTINLLHFQLHLTICFQEDPAITIMTTGDLPVKIACRAAQKLKGTRLVRSFWKFNLVKTWHSFGKDVKNETEKLEGNYS